MKGTGMILYLAWRNVWRYPRRTILTMLTIIAGCVMILLLNSLATGGHDQMIDDAVASGTGHIQIHEKGFRDNQSLEYALLPDDKLIAELKKEKKVRGISKRIQNAGLISYIDKTAGVIIQGIEPEEEKNITIISQRILRGGRYLTSGDSLHIIMGETLAENIKATVGSTISMISQGFDGSIAAEKLEIVGLFRTGNPEYDRSLILMPFTRAEQSFSMMGYINSIVIRLNESRFTDEIKKVLAEKIHGEGLEISGWDELMPELVQFIVMDDFSAYIFDFVLFMIVAFGIYNTIQMSVFERTREIGIMLSIGTSPGQVRSLIVYESFIITVIGLIPGMLIGSLLSIYFQHNPIDYSAYAKEITVWGVTTTLFPARLTALNLSVTCTLICISSLIFSFFPALRASRLNPVKAIRHL